MRNHFMKGQAALKNQTRSFILQIHGSAVAAQELLFFHPDRGGRELDLHRRIVVSEEQYSTSRPRLCKAFNHQHRLWRRQQNGIGSSAVGASANLLNRVCLRGIKRRGSAKTCAPGATRWYWITGEDSRAGKAREHHQQHSDGALPNDEDNLDR